MKHLLTIEQFKSLSRPVSRHAEENEINAFIDECERIYIIPAIGYQLYKQALTDTDAFDDTFDKTFDFGILLNGGEYIANKTCGCSGNEEERYCDGLRKAIAYFVYAKMLRNDGAIIARSGYMKHNDSYAEHMDIKEALRPYNDIMNIAEEYLKSTLEYVRVCRKIKPIAKRARYKAIGD